MSFDQGSAFLRAVMRLLGSTHPTRLGVGILIGFVLLSIPNFIKALMLDSRLSDSIAALPWYSLMSAGILLSYAPLIRSKRIVPEDWLTHFNKLDEAMSRANYNEAYRRLTYGKVIERLVTDTPKDGSADLAKITEELAAEADLGPPEHG